MRRLNLRAVFPCIIAAAIAGFSPAESAGQDPVKVAPSHYTVRLENEYVRVVEVRDSPGDAIPMHSHPDVVVYTITPAKRRFTFPDGRTRDVDVPAGQAIFQEALTHSETNTGSTPAHLILIELKYPKGTPKSTPDKAGDIVAVANPEYVGKLLENDRVRLLEYKGPKGAKTPMHSHPGPQVYVPLASFKRKVTFGDGQVVEVASERPALFTDPRLHDGEDTGDGTHMLVLELKDLDWNEVNKPAAHPKTGHE